MALRDSVVWAPEFLPSADLPERFIDATPSGIQNVAIREGVENYLNHFWDAATEGLAPVFSGRAGQYKTYGAAVILRYARHQMLPARFVECGPFFTRQDALFYTAQGRSELTALTTTPFVVLDDITQVAPNTRSSGLMSDLLAQRFSAKLPTVITLNFALSVATAQQLADMYRTDFARRVLHCSTGYRVVV